MNEAQLRKRFEVWKVRLGLEKWNIELVVAPCDADAFMETDRSKYYDRARITVQPWMLGPNAKSPDSSWVVQEINNEFVETSLVHELLHCCLMDLASVVNVDLEGFLHRDVDKQIYNSFHREEEKVVDRTAKALVQAFRKEGK